MPRRRARNVTYIKGTGQVDYKIVWRVFECAKPGCDQLLKASENAADLSKVTVRCPKCSFRNSGSYIALAPRWKYCRVCECLKPLESFDRHKPNTSSFRSGRQLECKSCKRSINRLLNPLRTREQHREASERRRLYGLLAGEAKINERAVLKRFGGKCFNCGKKLDRSRRSPKRYHLDHTLPARYLWPLIKGPTVLCSDCNNAKHDKWPSEFYSPKQLRQLAVLSGIPYDLLEAAPQLNPRAVETLLGNVDAFLARWVRYPAEIKKLRRLLIQTGHPDMYGRATFVPSFLHD